MKATIGALQRSCGALGLVLFILVATAINLVPFLIDQATVTLTLYPKVNGTVNRSAPTLEPFQTDT